MSSTLSTLQSKVDFYLGAQYIYNADNKTTALNAASLNLLLDYDISEFIVTTAMTFASGVADKPTGYLRYVKLFTTADPTDEYTRVDENDFDQEIAKTWTIKDSSGTQKLFIAPTDVTTGTTLRYVKERTVMSDSSDTSGFNTYWDEALACSAAWWLLFNDRQPVAAEKLKWATQLIKSALRHQGNENNQTPELENLYDENLMFSEDC